MPYINVDIDVEDFYDDLTTREKKELIQYLKEDGLLESEKLVEFSDNETGIGNPMDHEWVELINKINDARYQLTKEQEQILFNLAKSL